MHGTSPTSAFTLPTVYVVDDNETVQQSLQALLSAMGYRCRGYTGAQQFLESYHDDMLGCLLLDVRMPGMSGLELQQRLHDQHCLLPIVFMTGHGDVPMAVSAMQAGAVDFILKPFNDQELLERIDRALQRDILQRRMLAEKHQIRSRLESLSPREREILEMVVNGKANKVIAADLALSQRTVEIHRARVMEKMHATSLAQLVRMVIAVDESEAGDVGVTQLTRA